MIAGGKYYVITHAYYHYLVETREVNPRGIVTGRCVQIHSCGRGWTAFFADGCGTDTRYDILPEGGGLTVLNWWPWKNEIPSGAMKEPRR